MRDKAKSVFAVYVVDMEVTAAAARLRLGKDPS